MSMFGGLGADADPIDAMTASDIKTQIFLLKNDMMVMGDQQTQLKCAP